jgi:hypothetical protein
MNWYKRIILAKNKRKFKFEEFIKRLENYGVFVKRRAKAGYILRNINNGKLANIHHENKDVGDDVVRGVLRSLGVNYWSFVQNIPEPVVEEEEKEEVIPEWQRQPWFAEQRQLQEV